MQNEIISVITKSKYYIMQGVLFTLCMEYINIYRQIGTLILRLGKKCNYKKFVAFLLN